MNNTRIEYIDALRGFTMFLVVFWHVMALSFNIDSKDSIVGDIFLSFRMPMFFFISGFLGYKSLQTLKQYGEVIKKKAFIQLIPTAIFFSLFHLTHGSSPLVFFSEGLTGYWFTLVLFELFVVYYSIQYLTKKNIRLFIILMLLMVVFSNVAALYINTRPVKPLISIVLTLNNFFYYFQFFCMGVIVKMNEEIFRRLTHQTTFCIATILFIAIFYIKHEIITHDVNRLVFYCLDSIIVRYLGLIMVFSGFALSAQFFANNGLVSRTMQFVGRRTLDIYLIHYFFISSLSKYKSFFVSESHEFIIGEVFIFGIFAVAIIAVSLLISSFLRNSAFLSKILFGIIPKK